MFPINDDIANDHMVSILAEKSQSISLKSNPHLHQQQSVQRSPPRPMQPDVIPDTFLPI